MLYSYYNEAEDTEQILEVEYHYDQPETGSRWHPRSAGMIDRLSVTDENGIDITEFLPIEIINAIMAKCMSEVTSEINY